MKALLKNPKFYIWTVLVLLPFQALTFMYCLGTNTSAWVSMVTKQPERFAGFSDASNKLMYISLALFVIDIACLHIALWRLKNSDDQKDRQSSSTMQPAPAIS